MEREVDNQVAAPAETRTPNLHRANNRSLEECGWKGGDSGDSAERKSCLTNTTTDGTPTGLLMEGVYTQNPVVAKWRYYDSCRPATRMESLSILRGTRAWIVVPRLGCESMKKLPFTSFS